jgi:hypothetical protein
MVTEGSEYGHQILLSHVDRIEQAADWCREQFEPRSWFVYIFSDNKMGIFGFRTENQLFEFKMRWV